MLTSLPIAVLLSLGATPQAVREAESSFLSARKLLKKGRTNEACVLFEKSHALDPALGSLLNLANCREKQGKRAEAFELFNEAAAWAVRKKEKDREQLAVSRVNELRAQLSWLEVSIEDPLPGMLLSIEGRSWALRSENTVIPADPGKQLLRVMAPGHREWTSSVVIRKATEVVKVRIPGLAPLEEEPVKAQAPKVEPPPARVEKLPPPPAPEVSAPYVPEEIPLASPKVVEVSSAPRANPLGVPLLSTGVAVTLLGTAGLLVSHLQYEEARQDRQRFNTLAGVYTASWVGVGVGAACALLGSYFLWFAEPDPAVSLSVTPESSGARVSLQGRF